MVYSRVLNWVKSFVWDKLKQSSRNGKWSTAEKGISRVSHKNYKPRDKFSIFHEIKSHPIFFLQIAGFQLRCFSRFSVTVQARPPRAGNQQPITQKAWKKMTGTTIASKYCHQATRVPSENDFSVWDRLGFGWPERSGVPPLKRNPSWRRFAPPLRLDTPSLCVANTGLGL